jgi:hypothetical protein
MKIHVKKFLKFWNLTIADRILCWRCGSPHVVDLAHIEQKGPGGRDWVEFEENYIPLCRVPCHRETEGNAEAKEELYTIIVKRIMALKPLHKWTDGFKETSYYRNHPELW